MHIITYQGQKGDDRGVSPYPFAPRKASGLLIFSLATLIRK